MQLTDWNLEDALAVSREEGLADGLAEGLAEGLERGRAEGREALAETARNALAEGLPIHIVQKITGLDEKTIKNLEAKSP